MDTNTIASHQFDDDTLTINWTDGHTSQFHHIWLRDNAPDNRHANGQKLVETANIPFDSKPSTVSINGTVDLTWADDGSTSRFDPAWLRHNAYEQSEVGKRRQTIQTWKAADMQTLIFHDYANMAADDVALRPMLQSVRDHGFALITNVPTELKSLFKIIDLFGYVRETNYGTLFDVQVEPNPTNLAFTSLTLTGHTDNPYRHPVPGLQLLHVLNNNVSGGDSTLADGWAAAEALRERDPAAFELLSTTPVTFKFKSDDAHLEHEASIIETNKWGEVRSIRINNRSMQAFYTAPDKMKGFYKAYQTFAHMLEANEFKITFKLDGGQAMLFDNQRILHGRIGYESGGKRHLQGCYADMDSLLSKLEVLSRK